ncbi:MAG: hypothetical protein JWN90_69 [Parcubacteria group bacterium]|nr:hypothetical protein [Parcubacteria group bacterium]
MKFGRFNPFPSRQETVSPEKPKSVLYEDADPTQYSTLSPTKPLEDTGSLTQLRGKKILTDGVDRYVQLDSSMSPERQQVIARMLKGIINVADIVTVENKKGLELYSRILPHEKIQRKSTQNEIVADQAILELVFGDYDRVVYEKYGMNDKEHHNLRIEGGIGSFFDFGGANFELPIHSEQLIVEKTEVYTFLKNQLDQLEARFAGPQGREFLDSVIRASGKTIAQLFPKTEGNSNVEDFQDMLLSRILTVRGMVKHSLKYQFDIEAAAA